MVKSGMLVLLLGLAVVLVVADAAADRMRIMTPIMAASDAGAPLMMRMLLADFEISYQAADGSLHLNSFGLYQNYDSWITRFLPWQVRGQAYCHVATVEYVKALAAGESRPYPASNCRQFLPLNWA